LTREEQSGGGVRAGTQDFSLLISMESLERGVPALQADHRPIASTLVECLTWWARRQPEACFAAFWNGDGQPIASYTYAQFEARTRDLAYSFGASMNLAA
jgi:hypothetical protein